MASALVAPAGRSSRTIRPSSRRKSAPMARAIARDSLRSACSIWRRSAGNAAPHCEPLVLYERAREARGQIPEAFASARDGGCIHIVREVPPARRIPAFQAMNARGRPSLGLEQVVEIIDRATADQRDGAPQLVIHPGQQVSERGFYAYAVRCRRQFEQGTVDIQEQAPGQIGNRLLRVEPSCNPKPAPLSAAAVVRSGDRFDRTALRARSAGRSPVSQE